MFHNTTNNNTQFISAPKLPFFARLDPSLALNVCSWLDDYIEFSKYWSPRSFDGYHEAVGIWLLSMIAARRVGIIFGFERYTNIYILLVGRSTLYKKTTAVRIAKDLLQNLGLDFLLLPEESTPQSMILAMSGKKPVNYEQMLSDQKQHIDFSTAFAGQRGLYSDEFGSHIQAMMRRDGPYSDFRSILRKFDDTPKVYRRSTILRGDESVSRPYLALLGVLTISDLAPFSGKGSMLWGDGYFGRMALVCPPDGLFTYEQFPEGERIFPSSLIKPLREWHERLGTPDGNNGYLNINNKFPIPVAKLKLSKDAHVAYYNYDKALLDVMANMGLPDLDSNYGRFPEKALRISGLIASLENSEEININHWARGQEIAERWRTGLHEIYRQVNEEVVKNRSLSNEEKVLKAIAEKNFPTKREIEQYTGLTKTEVEPILEKPISDGIIIMESVGRTSRYRLANLQNDNFSK